MRYIVNHSSNCSKPKLKTNWEQQSLPLPLEETSTSLTASVPSTCSPEQDLVEVIERCDLVHVVWVDAQTSGGSGWQDAEDMVEAMRAPAPLVHTVGFLMHSDEERIAVCDTIQEDGTAGGYVHLIPNGMLKELVALTPTIPLEEDND